MILASQVLQWRNRLAHGTYRQYARNAGVVSSSLTWSTSFYPRPDRQRIKLEGGWFCAIQRLGGCSSVVERPLRMRKASGSIPDISMTCFASLAHHQRGKFLEGVNARRKKCWGLTGI